MTAIMRAVVPDAIEAFRAALAARGLVPPDELIADGRIHRCDVAAGKRGNGDGAYLLHTDGVPAGGYQNHRDGLGWQNWRAPLRRMLTAPEMAAHRARMEAAERARAKDEARRRAEAAERAASLWRTSEPAPADHAYLRDKGVRSHGLRAIKGRLMVPLRIGEELVSLQSITADGEKRFLSGGRTRGAWHLIGTPGETICIAEGYATGASVHEATGLAVAVAFYCANLEPVAQALRQRHPQARIIVCADDDYRTAGNPGLAHATAAARAVGGVVAVPDFGAQRPDGCTDLNDLARLRGAEAVRACIEAASAPSEAQAAETAPGPDAAAVELVRGDAMRIEPVRWLWDGWLALGKLHILAGAPGTGKTTIALAIAATVTIGGRWPDGTRAEPADVVMWSGEDDPADTLAPRLLATGADLRRVQFVTAARDEHGRRAFDPARDMPALADALLRSRPRLLVLDPIVNAVGSDSHKNGEVRRALAPVVELAAEIGCAVLGISHFSKGTAGRDPVERVTGSLAFSALARVVLVAAKQPEDQGGGRLLARAKSNLGPDGGGFAYTLQVSAVPGRPEIEATRVLWGAALEGTARELLGKAEAEPEAGGEGRDAGEWLREALADGEVDARTLRRLTEDAGYAWRSMQRVAHRIGATAVRTGFGAGAKYVWRLPMRATNPPCAPCAPNSECGVHGEHGVDGATEPAPAADREVI